MAIQARDMRYAHMRMGAVEVLYTHAVAAGTHGGDVITLGLSESLAMRRLRRHASHSGFEEQWDEEPCAVCGRVWFWNTYIYPANEPRRCEGCAPDEHWTTGVPRSVADAVFWRQERMGVL